MNIVVVIRIHSWYSVNEHVSYASIISSIISDFINTSIC